MSDKATNKIAPGKKPNKKSGSKGKKSPGKREDNNKALRALPPDRQQFVLNYIDKGNETTYCNQTQSLLAARPHIKPDSARSTAPAIIASSSVQEAIIEQLENAGCGIKVRSNKLSQIINGDHSTKVRTKQYNKDKELVGATVTVREPSTAETLKAIETANKMDGTYTNAQATANAVGEGIKALFKARLKASQEKGGGGKS